MAVLSVELNYLPGVQSSIAGVVSQLESRKSDYEGAINKVNRIGASTDCNIYLKKKNQQLQDKIDKLNNFKSRVSNFSANVKAADQRVATHVRDESAAFYETVGIKTGWQAAVEAIKDFAVNAWETVKEFYQKHKYVIDLIVDIALLAVAVVAIVAAIPTGGATLVFAGFALAQAVGDLVTSSVALGFHIAGDDETAGVWAERGLKDGIQLIGDGIDWLAETTLGIESDFFKNLTGFAYDVMSVASIGYSFYKSGKGILKAIKNDNFRKVKLKGIKLLFGLDLTPGESKAGYKAITNTFSFIKNGKQAYTLTRVCGYFKNVKTTFNIVDSLFKGTFLTDGLKVTKDIKSAWSSLNSAAKAADNGFTPNYNFAPAM